MSVVNTVAAKKWAATLDDYKKKGYVVLAAVLTFGISYYYYNVLNRPVASVLFFIGGGVIFFYYWVKWFLTQQLPDPDFNPAALACPDYLSVVPNDSGLYTPTSPTQYFCVDYVGVSRNGGLKKMNPADVATNINNPAYTFSIDPSVDFISAASKGAFMNRLVAAGLSYNSVGDSSLPTQDSNSNNSPAFSG